MDKTYYTIYKITNKIDGKFYIGSHKTKNLDDKYMGSGKYLQSAREKYGLENFEKEILFIFDTPEEMYAKESEIVNEDFLTVENTYNLKVGGFGGWDYINSSGLNIRTEEQLKAGGRAMAFKIKNNEEYAKLHSSRSSETIKRTHEMGKFKYDTFKDKTHTKETKRKIGEKNSINQLGEKNSQYGKRWIHNLELKISKKIKKEENLPFGWKEGRKIKFD